MSTLHRPILTLALVLAAGALPVNGAPADKSAAIPQFGFADYAWSKVSDDFQLPESGPGPVTSDKEHPYVSNVRATGARTITLRIADLTNPILKPWAIEQMRKANELAAAGKQAYEARASCRPGGVPGGGAARPEAVRGTVEEAAAQGGAGRPAAACGGAVTDPLPGRAPHPPFLARRSGGG